jgi:hypothetical protein
MTFFVGWISYIGDSTHTLFKEAPAMIVTMRPISSIRPYDNNPRFNDAAVAAVAASIKEFGWRQPIVVDDDGVIIVGHCRYKAAIKLGHLEVPVHIAVGLTPAQAKAYRISDNQTAQLSGWDDDKLVQELLQLQQAIPTTCPTRLTRRSRSPATCGCWGNTVCYAAIPPRRKTWIASWTELRST